MTAEYLINTAEAFLEQHGKFSSEILGMSLKACNVHSSEWSLYRTFLGSYFGQRPNRKKKPVAKKGPDATTKVEIDPRSGQHGWTF